MSVISKLAESIDNGLQIAEFIQENREELQKTYGRSAISDPKSKERIQAWETFISKKAESDSRSEGSKSGRDDSRGGIENSNKNDNRTRPSKIPNSAGSVNKPNGDRDNNSRHDSDLDTGENIESYGNYESVGHSDRGGSADMEGDDEHESSPGDIKGDDNNTTTNDEIEGAAGGKEDQLFSVRMISIKETTPEDLEQMLEEIRPVPSKRLRNIGDISKVADDMPTALPPIKKTTQESSVSTHLVGKPLLRAGATQGVQESLQSQPTRSVSVESALTDAHSVSTTMTDDEQSDETGAIANSVLMIKFDEILSNQKKILEKLSVLTEVKEEIAGIKKVLTNHGVALSTVESYISDLKIIIPKSGVEDKESNGPINQDLRMVIGRDRTRARHEVIKSKPKSNKIDISEDLYVIPEIDDQFVTKSLDNKFNNAANFVPTDDKISIEIIKGIIHNEVGDPEMINEFLELVDVGVHTMSVREVYDNVRSLLNELHTHEAEHYNRRSHRN